MTAGCACPAHNWTEPPRPDYVIKPWALMQIRHMAQTVHRAVAAGEGMVAAGEIDRRSALDLRRGYVAAVDLLTGFHHLADTGLLIEAADSRLLAVEESMLDRPRRRRPAV